MYVAVNNRVCYFVHSIHVSNGMQGWLMQIQNKNVFFFAKFIVLV